VLSRDENAFLELADEEGQEQEMRTFSLQDPSQAAEGVEE